MNSLSKSNVVVLAVSGGSGSGKTTLATLLGNYYGESGVVISLDSYYKDLSHLPLEKIVKVNFDHPNSIDFELFKENIENLKNNKSINIPVYSFKEHSRQKDTVKINPHSIIILEGLYSFYDKEMCDLADYKVYVEASNDIRLIRRIRRDVVERGRDVESVINQYEATVRKMHKKYIETQKHTADLVIENNGEVELEDIIGVLIKEISNL